MSRSIEYALCATTFTCHPKNKRSSGLFIFKLLFNTLFNFLKLILNFFQTLL